MARGATGCLTSGTHVRSLAHLMGSQGCASLADHGVEALRTRFHDGTHGGWYAKVGVDGPRTKDKTAYEHAFVVLAGASAAAAGRSGGSELALTPARGTTAAYVPAKFYFAGLK